MLFNSFPFLFLFLPIVLFVARALRGQRLLRWICIASFTFYAFAGHIWFLLPMLVTTVLDFYLAQKIEAASGPRRKYIFLMFSLIGNLGLLIYFKYAALFLKTGVGLYSIFAPGSPAPAWLSIFNVILPAGISFYTFQTLSYVIDVYRGHCHAERNFWLFSGFVSFFPHLVAGPLTRHNQLIPGLQNIAKDGIKSRWEEGLYLFSIGLAKKVLIADRIAAVIDPVILNVGDSGPLTAWLALIGYALQIYFDFSGYSDMAIGLARLFGIELPQNFNRPYRALNPSDFWRRWHITLSLWLRDYLYITLGGNRCSPRRQKINLILTMLLGGLWHGAQWTFAAWGLYHGLLLVMYHWCQEPWDRLPIALQRWLTFILICLGWVFFRATSFQHAGLWFSRLFAFNSLDFFSSANEQNLLRLLSWAVVGLLIVNLLPAASRYSGFKSLKTWQQIGLGVLTAVAVLYMTTSSKFLYFQF